ncbi:MAG: hypothetical protein CMJ89_10370, partial [Planctomycetes bacterium]|nr:hypothetical protein [Planctomycetota bacterium]
MTSAIVETLAKEFSVKTEHAERVFELLGRGSKVPYIARYRRAEIGSFNDGTLRRFARRLKQLEELERRRGSLLRSLEEQSKKVDAAKEGAGAKTPAADAGSSPGTADGGAEPADEGAEPADEGATPADEGATPADEGVTAADEGVTAADEGVTAADEGVTAADEGATAADEGVNEVNAAAAAETKSKGKGKSKSKGKGKGRAKDPLRALRSCMDRFELEDLFQPHRRPEPEVQLALDRGLGYLADLLVEPLPAGAAGAEEEEGKGVQESEASTEAAQPSEEGQEAPAIATEEASPEASVPPSGEALEDSGGAGSSTEEAQTEEAQTEEAQTEEAQTEEAQT